MLSKNRRLPHQMPQKSLQANFIAATKSEPHPGGNDGDGDKESTEWREQAVEHHSTVIGLASLVSSYVRVHSCTILLNGLTSPFWVSGGMGDADHSMVFVECSHQSPSSPTLLPLVSCTRPSDQSYADSPIHPYLDERHHPNRRHSVSPNAFCRRHSTYVPILFPALQ
ncbi:hypothetical protein BLNAU_1042 [Blattamonas nauphoetae]|uniref:Uncharacterized protein n=1 Tax=Blattamonas nauphoetae TaxID=2049346 RepID=A0ABQ9YK66_9EUKA|nr:hypothetical protein BLNAU_1042 [Blattamonas nauphoetae]